MYERVCKILQFMVFVAFALVGSNFSPPEDEEVTGAADPREGRSIQHLVCNSTFTTTDQSN